MQPYITELEDDERAVYIHPASQKSVDRVLLLADPDDVRDGRSPFMWVRLPNGDLCLAIFPYGATYDDCEVDAQYPR